MSRPSAYPRELRERAVRMVAVGPGWVDISNPSHRLDMQQRGRSDQQDRPPRGNNLASAASSIRSAGAHRGLPTWRRSTASPWRSTAISTASAFGVGPRQSTPSTCRTIINANVRTTTTRSLPAPHHRSSYTVPLRWHPSRPH